MAPKQNPHNRLFAVRSSVDEMGGSDQNQDEASRKFAGVVSTPNAGEPAAKEWGHNNCVNGIPPAER